MKKISLILFYLIISNLVFSQNEILKIDSLVKATSIQNPEIGISVGFIEGNNQYFFNYGFTDRTKRIKVNEKATFEIGSITKLVTSYLLLQQVEAGKIHLDSMIDGYLPDFLELNSAIKNKIKVSDLASHQSGLPGFDMMHLIEINPTQPLDEVTLEMVDSILVNTTSLESFGSYRYSNISYVLLGYIIENVVGDTYENIVKNNMLQPFRMKNTYTTDYKRGVITTGYNMQNERRDFLNWNSVMAPAGLLKSNSSDLVEFIRILLSPEYQAINDKLQNTYFKNTFIELGLGLNILRADDHVIYAKTGDSLGQSSVLAYNPKQKWGVVILTNQANSIAREVFGKIVKIMK